MAELKLEQKQEPGKLRIYIGAAPGVGKTYVMLNDAYRMVHEQRIDVVIGLVEPHGRQETKDRIRDLEIIPLRVIPYRGVELKEMDVGKGPVPYLRWKMGRSYYRLILSELGVSRVDVYRTPARDQVHVLHFAPPAA